MSKFILSLLMAALVFGFAALNIGKLFAIEHLPYSEYLGIALALVFVLVFWAGKNRYHDKEPEIRKSGLIMMSIAVLIEVGVAFFFGFNVSHQEIAVKDLNFSPDSIEITHRFQSKIAASNANFAKETHNSAFQLAKLQPNQTTKRGVLTQKIALIRSDSMAAQAKLTSELLAALSEKKEALKAQNQADVNSAISQKKAVNLVLACLNLMLYGFIFLLSMGEKPTTNPSFWTTLKTQFYAKHKLFAQLNAYQTQISALSAEIEDLTAKANQVSDLQQKAQQAANEVDRFRNDLEQSRKEVENISNLKARAEQKALEAEQKLMKLEKFLQIYILAPFTINHSSMIYWVYKDGAIKHELIGKSNWRENEVGITQMLNEKLGLESKKKERGQTEKSSVVMGANRGRTIPFGKVGS